MNLCGETRRWGRKFVDKRNWVRYNEELVVRGEFLLDLEWVISWDKELEQMNTGKRGRKFEYPELLIRLQAVWYQWIDYRGIEGVTRVLMQKGLLPACNDYTTANRRINRLETDFTLPKSGSVCVSTDGTGMKFENAGEYRKRMYGKKRRKYIRVVLTADPISRKLLRCEVSVEGEGLSEPDTALLHMEQLMAFGLTIKGFWGDGAFDKIDLFNFMEDNHIESAVKIDKNAVPNEESPRRTQELEKLRKMGYRKWARSVKYGLRWTGTEGIFSAVKRKSGEETRSKKLENALKEVQRKFWAYDEMKEYAKARV